MMILNTRGHAAIFMAPSASRWGKVIRKKTRVIILVIHRQIFGKFSNKENLSNVKVMNAKVAEKTSKEIISGS
jgi:hypothetical protein